MILFVSHILLKFHLSFKLVFLFQAINVPDHWMSKILDVNWNWFVLNRAPVLALPSFFSFFCPSHDLKIPCDICP